VLAPVALRFVEAPGQIVADPTVIVGVGLTVIVAVATAVQLAAEDPVIVYAVVVVGLAVTALPVVALKPVAGLHVYVLAPLAVNEVEVPAQIVGEPTVKVGVGFTVTVVVAVVVQPAADVAVIV
jgi:hypothetical protein